MKKTRTAVGRLRNGAIRRDHGNSNTVRRIRESEVFGGIGWLYVHRSSLIASARIQPCLESCNGNKVTTIDADRDDDGDGPLLDFFEEEAVGGNKDCAD